MEAVNFILNQIKNEERDEKFNGFHRNANLDLVNLKSSFQNSDVKEGKKENYDVNGLEDEI